jgi:hypothetical protein
MDFSQVAAEFSRLKAQYDAGTLSEADFKARLHDLMIQDGQDRWWMMGYETGHWYVHDGEHWVQSEPPSVAERGRGRLDALRQEGKTEPEGGNWAPAMEKSEAAPEPGHAEAPRPEAMVRPAALPAAPRRGRWVWVMALVIGIIGLILLLLSLQRGGIIPGAGRGQGPVVRLWADRDVIMRGECTVLHWEAPGAEHVRIAGPGFDPQVDLPGGGARDICPEVPTGYELLSPDGQVMARIEIQVRE